MINIFCVIKVFTNKYLPIQTINLLFKRNNTILAKDSKLADLHSVQCNDNDNV